MAQANDSILVTPGSGATVATHNPGDSKEYQVVMLAGDKGHIHGQVAQSAAQQMQDIRDEEAAMQLALSVFMLET